MFAVFTLIAITAGVLVLGGVVTAHPARVIHVTASASSSVDMTNGPPVKPVPPNLAPNVVQTRFCVCYQCKGKDHCWRARGPPKTTTPNRARPICCRQSASLLLKFRPISTTESASHPAVTRDGDSVKLK